MCVLRDILKYGEITYSLEDKSNYLSFHCAAEADLWGYPIYSDWAKEFKKTTYMVQQILKKQSSILSSPLECYCGYLFDRVNTYLRSVSDDRNSSISSELANILIYVLSSAPRISNNIIVYRMVCDEFMNYLISQNKKGILAIEKGFMSTSMLETIANQDEPYTHHNNILKIYVPKNTVGVYVNSVTRRNEQELLLAPNRYIGMIGYPKKHPSGKLITECKLINFETDLRIH